MRSSRIIVVGSCNTDMIMKVARVPRAGETVLGGEFLMAAGGKGANQATGAVRAGGNVAFVGRVGNDVFGAQAIAGFVADGIDVQHVYRDRRAPSGIGLIFVDRRGENRIAVASGANARLSPADVRKAARLFTGAGIVLMQLEVPLLTVHAAALLATQAGARVILNPAPARQLPDKLLRHVSILTPNQTEAEMLTGVRVTSRTAAARAASMLRARGVQTVIITLGAGGALVASERSTQLVPGFKVHAVDTTGAGDVFNGALAAALSEKLPLMQAVRFANAAAAISVTRMGAQRSAPSRRQIGRLFK